MPLTSRLRDRQPLARPEKASLSLALTLAAMGVFGPFSIDTPFPAFKQMGAALGADSAAMQLLVSVYLLAFAGMSIFHGPISDAVGRKPVVIVGALVYALASLGCAFSPTLPMLLVFRAAQGMSAGSGMIIGRAVVRDLFSGAEAQRQMAMVSMVFAVAPAIAPVIGGLILLFGPWQWIFVFLALWGVVVAGLVALTLPESHPLENRVPLQVGPLLRGLAGPARHGRFQRLAFAMMLTFAGQFVYISGAPIFVRDLLGLGEQDFWIMFVPMILGIMGGAWVQNRLAEKVSGQRLVHLGIAIALATGVANVLFALIPATRGQLPWAVLAPGGIAFGVQLAFPVLTIAMLDLFPHGRGSAASMQAFQQLLLNAAIAGLLVPLVTGSVLTMALASLGLMSAGALLWLGHVTNDRRVARRGADDVARGSESVPA